MTPRKKAEWVKITSLSCPPPPPLQSRNKQLCCISFYFAHTVVVYNYILFCLFTLLYCISIHKGPLAFVFDRGMVKSIDWRMLFPFPNNVMSLQDILPSPF